MASRPPPSGPPADEPGGHGSGGGQAGAGNGPHDASVPPTWQIVLAVQAVVLMIAVAMAVVPSKTGSGGFADYLFDDPTFAQKVGVGFVITELLVGVLAVAGWWVLRSRRRAATPTES